MTSVAPPGGLILYRCWGGSSTEWGTGYFSREKPASVLDAELRFNIADWGNSIHFVSTFRLKEGFHFLHGPVEHGASDFQLAGTQVFIFGPLEVKLDLVRSREILVGDVFVSPRAGKA